MSKAEPDDSALPPYQPLRHDAYQPPPHDAYQPPHHGAYQPPHHGAYQPPPHDAYQPPPNDAYQPTGQQLSAPGCQPPSQGFQPLAPGYSSQMHGNTTAVVVTQPGYVGPLPGGSCRYGDYPCLIVCQFCTATVTTNTRHTVGTFPWLICALICLFGCWVGCCLIPFCVECCHDVIHTCPNCRATVGRFNRL